MAAGLGTRLPGGCASRWPRGWRLAHAGPAARLQQEYDAVVIGAGHNGLVAAAYLQQAGLRTAVLERRHVLGGAAVTEEIVPGFKFSRASYLLSLLRPQIYTELELQRHGLRVLPRDPYSFTPLLEDRSPPRSLLLGHDAAQTQRQIAQFSPKDAQAYPEYEAFMGGLVAAIDPLLDAPPADTAALGQGSLLQRLRALRALRPLLRAGLAMGRQLPRYYEVLTAPISKVLDHWFESEPLKATLATDAVIGAMASPRTPGSGYVLLHHVMGTLEGQRGAWGYVAGGMGALSQAIASAAAARGAHIFAEKVPGFWARGAAWAAAGTLGGARRGARRGPGPFLLSPAREPRAAGPGREGARCRPAGRDGGEEQSGAVQRLPPDHLPGAHPPETRGTPSQPPPGLSCPRSSCRRTLSSASSRLTRAPLSPRSTWRWIGCPTSWPPRTPVTASPCPITSAPSTSTARAPSSSTRLLLRPATGTPPAGP
ncbi:pyridine nucleotide-disulfide oxidoreductase domain-containing protein 2 isoform X4 [Apteryx mantelli]|uniref:Pyridine nucleotide-disulfide oxidoreductase domain-containing protein 2 isoform X4 n=1 Tax=Apteryx mantelli TaxID=2696672 RepID=A0ABM4ESH0_9AVES